MRMVQYVRRFRLEVGEVESALGQRVERMDLGGSFPRTVILKAESLEESWRSPL